LLAILALVALPSCSPNAAGREAITNRCVAGGEKLEVCECFAEESSRRLEKPMFELVVLGAQGRESEAEEVMKSLGPHRHHLGENPEQRHDDQGRQDAVGHARDT
jgi:hypothetical protein